MGRDSPSLTAKPEARASISDALIPSPPLSFALRKGWWKAAALGLLAAAVGYGIPSIGTRTYQADAQVFINVDAAAQAAPAQVVSTAAVLATSNLVLRPVAAQLGITVQQLHPSVAATPATGANVVDLAATASTPTAAVKLANLVELQKRMPGHPAVITFNAEENRHMLDVNEEAKQK